MTEEERVEREIDRDIQRQRNTRILQAVLALVGVLIVVSFNFWFTIYSQDQNNQKWCKLMVTLDDRNQRLPPNPDPDAQLFAAQVHDLRQGLKCSGTTPSK